jgi:DNA-binding NarL/FixJ family response regulator
LPLQAIHEQANLAARTALGEAAYEAALAAGRCLSIDQAVVEAIGLCQTLAPIESSKVKPRKAFDLTNRELDVLLLTAAGRSNHEIADELFIAVATVKRHLSNIYRKIGTRSRSAAAAFAHQNGLV